MTERELVNRFLTEEAPLVVERWGADQTALDEAFNDWTDQLCKSGEISEALYNEACMIDLTDRQFIKLLEGNEVQL